MPLKWSESRSVLSDPLRPHGLSRLNSPGLNTGVGGLSLLQWSFPTRGLNPGHLHYRQILYQLSHQGSPRIPEWVPLHNPYLVLKYFFHLTSLFHNDLWSYITKCFKTFWRKFLAVLWWGLCACAAGDTGLIPDQRRFHKLHSVAIKALWNFWQTSQMWNSN